MSPITVTRSVRDSSDSEKCFTGIALIARPTKQETSIVDHLPSRSEESLTQTISYLDALKSSKTVLLADSVHPTAALGSHSPDVLGGSWASLRDAAKQLAIPNSGMDYLANLAARRQVDPYEGSDQFTPDFLPALSALALNQFLVEITASTASETSGPHFTFIDPGLHLNEGATVLGARRLIDWMKIPHPYEGWDIPVKDIIISIPATKQGIEATRVLAKEGVRVNLYSVCNLPHALACVEAGAEWISIPVDRVMRWYEGLNRGPDPIAILTYFRMKNIGTKIVGMDFRRNFGHMDLACLAGFDAVCLSEWHLDRRLRSTVPSVSLDAFRHVRGRTEGEGAGLTADLLDRLAQRSIESELMTQDVVSDELRSMARIMTVIESAVHLHTSTRFSIAYRGEWPEVEADEEATLLIDPVDQELTRKGSLPPRDCCPSPEWPTSERDENDDEPDANATIGESPRRLEACTAEAEEAEGPENREKFDLAQLARKQTIAELLSSQQQTYLSIRKARRF
ncbi:hypothetical protein BKA70DRAFT_1346259 [Coprinopsis sp. MPI-PUGE-AT-0042]|nr:hypothetical protein BKA70DRAFT_1346259 [Coprinopsis sp. MPI-PUGE-AT-0042]